LAELQGFWKKNTTPVGFLIGELRFMIFWRRNFCGDFFYKTKLDLERSAGSLTLHEVLLMKTNELE
jgi:hypothetical protein